MLGLLDGLRGILRLIETSGSEGLRSTDDDRALIALLRKLKARGGEPSVEGEPTSQTRDLGHPDLSNDLPGKERTLRILTSRY